MKTITAYFRNGRKEYRLVDNDTGMFYEVTKIEHDFAKYLLDNFKSIDECIAADGTEGYNELYCRTK